jgi:pantetheine-phosphate adenylyltransferase
VTPLRVGREPGDLPDLDTALERSLRVTGGELRGRRIRVPRGDAVRPTADRVREAVFARLGTLAGADVLDVFAGSGALGIEALSRGAASAVFVERSPVVAAVLRENLRTLDLLERATLVRADVGTALRRLAAEGRRFHLALLDPPYADVDARARALRGLATSGILAPRATVLVEASRREPPPTTPGLRAIDERRYGDTVVHWLEAEERKESMSAARSDQRLAVFPASFDPVTNGHLDLIHRAHAVFDELVVAVARNVAKQGTFSVEERVELIQAAVGHEPGIRITSFDGLLVDYARQIGASVVIRGLRAVSDFEYEFEMALMNRHLYPDVETLFMMTSQKYFYVSSSRLKELVRFGAAIEDFVPPMVAKRLKEKLGGA